MRETPPRERIELAPAKRLADEVAAWGTATEIRAYVDALPERAGALPEAERQRIESLVRVGPVLGRPR